MRKSWKGIVSSGIALTAAVMMVPAFGVQAAGQDLIPASSTEIDFFGEVSEIDYYDAACPVDFEGQFYVSTAFTDEDYDGAIDAQPSSSYVYTMDASGRVAGYTLYSLNEDDGTQYVGEAAVFTRDAAGKILSKTRTFYYNGSMEAGSVETDTYTYDGAGNLIQIDTDTLYCEEGYSEWAKETFEYNEAGQVSAEYSEDDYGEYAIYYTYNETGDLIAKDTYEYYGQQLGTHIYQSQYLYDTNGYLREQVSFNLWSDGSAEVDRKIIYDYGDNSALLGAFTVQ